MLWGLGRSLALEHPEIWGGVIDLDDSMPAELAVRQVLAAAGGADEEDQVVYRSGARHVPRLQRRTPPAGSPVKLGSDNGEATSQLVIGATGNIGPHLIRQLARMGAKTVVAVARKPGSLQELAQSLASTGTNLIEVAADATDAAAMSALFDRFGTDLPPLEGIYLAAFAGGPVLLREMTDDDVAAMFNPKLNAATLLHRVIADKACAAVRFVLLRSPVYSVPDGSPTTPRPAPSWIPSLTRAALWGCRPPSSTGDCGNPWPTRRKTRARSAPNPDCNPWLTRSPSARCRWR